MDQQVDLSIMDPLWEMLQNGNYVEVEKQTLNYINSPLKHIAKDAAKLMGMSFFMQEKYETAVQYYEKAAVESTEVSDFFNIMTSATLAGQVQKGRDAYEKAIKLQVDTGHKQQPSIPFIKYYYICALRDIGKYQLTLEHINDLRSVYEQLKIADTTFLYIRGVPFLSNTLEVIIDIFNRLGDAFDGLKWLKEFSLALDEEGKNCINEAIAKLQRK